MRKSTILAVALAAFLVPGAASAQFTLGARLGYAIVGGDAVKDGPMDDVVSSMVPLQLEAGYAITPEFNLGAFYSYGFGQLSSNGSDMCDALGADCSLSNWRLGLQGTFTFLDLSQAWAPWIGFGMAYESAKLTLEAGGQKATSTNKGWELANLQLGCDYKAGAMRFGPFLSYSFGKFGSFENEGGGLNESGDITDKGTHTYLTIGIRGQFGL
jgi:hypothetical protein